MTANALYIEKEARRMARDAQLTKMPFLAYLLEMAAEEAKREAISREPAIATGGRDRAHSSAVASSHSAG